MCTLSNILEQHSNGLKDNAESSFQNDFMIWKYSLQNCWKIVEKCFKRLVYYGEKNEK